MVAKLVTELIGSWPSPETPQTCIRFSIAEPGPVRLSIYDLGGRLINVLLARELNADVHEITWQGEAECGRQVASGIYLARLEAADFKESKKLILINPVPRMVYR